MSTTPKRKRKRPPTRLLIEDTTITIGTQAKNGRAHWCLTYQLSNGDRRRVFLDKRTHPDLTDAQAHIRAPAFRETLRTEATRTAKLSREDQHRFDTMAVGTLLDTLITQRRNVTPNTRICYRQARNYAATHFGDRKASTITPTDAQAFYDWMRTTRKLSAATASNALNLLSGLIRRAHKSGKLAANPFTIQRNGDDTGIEMERPITNEAWPFTDAELNRLVIGCDCMPDPLYWRTLITLAYETGMRIGELEHQCWTNLDLDSSPPTYTVVGRPASSIGGVPIFAWLPKAGALKENRGNRGPLPFPWTTNSIALLRQLHTHCTNANTLSPYVFLDAPRVHHLQATRVALGLPLRRLINVTRPLAKIAAAAKVPLTDQARPNQSRSFHNLRDTFCTYLLDVIDVPAEKVIVWTGHSSVEILKKHYVPKKKNVADLAALIQRCQARSAPPPQPLRLTPEGSDTTQDAQTATAS